MSATLNSEIRDLKRLAKLYGIQTTYRNAATGRPHEASSDALLAVLRALGARVSSLRDTRSAVAARVAETGCRALQPVTTAWNGRFQATLCSRVHEAADLSGSLKLESGETRRLHFDLSSIPMSSSATIDGLEYVYKKLSLPVQLPHGYHYLQLEIEGSSVETLIISAPPTAYDLRVPEGEKTWGLFVPLYGVHSSHTVGAGDLGELDAIARWTLRLDGHVVSTLPLLATFLDSPCDPSPYAPASRLFWNEFYLDLKRIPGWDNCRQARALCESGSVKSAVESLSSQTLVDYQQTMKIKRKVLEELAQSFYSHSIEHPTNFQRFLNASPRVEDYASFRAACERQGGGWKTWPQPIRDGVIRAGDYNPEVQRYHVYVQWQMHEQLQSLFEKYRRVGLTFCLDLPLGIHPEGYDVWRGRKIFAQSIHGGAPPDSVFTKGQDWGFPPLNPYTLRAERYRYYIDCLRHQMSHAGMLRVDHVMGLHRLFWIPEGFDPAEGVYVRYNFEELYAILALESSRNRSIALGENLGAVPAYVNTTMAKRNVKKMYVLQYELAATPGKQPRDPSSAEVASLNTHDMPHFSAFLDGLDIEGRRASSLLNEPGTVVERRSRELQRKQLVKKLRQRGWLGSQTPDALTLVQACLKFLSASPSPVIFVNLEDLWLETQPQNVPGASDRPNWRRKLRHAREVFCELPQVTKILREVALVRKGGRRLRSPVRAE